MRGALCWSPSFVRINLSSDPKTEHPSKSIVAEELNQNESRREFGVHVFYSKSTSFLQGLKPIL
jgi:hypothetical protein